MTSVDHASARADKYAPIEPALALHAAGALTQAEAAYRRLLGSGKAHVEAQHYLGVLLHQRGETRKGIALILAALEADADSACRFNDLGNVLFQAGDLANAATAFDCAVRLSGGDANVWNNLGTIRHRQGRIADAESAYRSALRSDATFAPALNNLAALLAATGNEEESSLLSCRAFIQPPLAGKHPKMLGIAYYRLERIAEAADCYRNWLRAEPDNAVALHHLAACTGENVPSRAPDGFLTAVFDDVAERYEEKLVGKLSYRGPEIIAGLLSGCVAPDRTRRVLDGGCGTGLCARVLLPCAKHLTGVDISSGMLARARESALYDELVEAELCGYLAQRKNEFDLIVMADTLMYFGDLAPLFAAAGRALRPAGAFAFTVEAAVESAQRPLDYRLSPSGRYRHSRRYLAQELESAGFALARSDDAALRSEFGTPTPGIGVLARLLPG